MRTFIRVWTIILLALVAISCQIDVSKAYTGNCGIWALKKTSNQVSFIPTNFPGTQAGFDAAKAWVGQRGYISIQDACDFITIGTLPDSVFVYWIKGGELQLVGRKVTLSLKDQTVSWDSTGLVLPLVLKNNLGKWYIDGNQLADSASTTIIANTKSSGVLDLGVVNELAAIQIKANADVAIKHTVAATDTVRGDVALRTSGFVSTPRLGPASGPTSGGAIRVVDGVTFPLTGAGVQAAIQEVHSVGGGTVLVPRGAIPVGTAIVLPDSVSVVGMGKGITTFQHSGSTLHGIFIAHSSKKISLKNFSIDGDIANVSSYTSDRWNRVPAVEFDSCGTVQMEDVEMYGHRGQAVYGTNCQRVSISNSDIHDTDDWGFVFKATDDFSAFNTHVWNVFTQGIYVDGYNTTAGSNRVQIVGCSARNCQNDATHTNSGVGISVQKNNVGKSGVYDVTIAACVADSNGAMGFSLTPGSRSGGFRGRMTVTGCTSKGHTSNVGIAYEIIGNDVTAAGNVAENNKYGWTVQDSRNVQIGPGIIRNPLGSSNIACIVTPSDTSAWVQDVAWNDMDIRGGTGYQISATAAYHRGIRVKGGSCRDCEYGFLSQDPHVDRLTIENYDVDNTGATLGRGIQCYAESVLTVKGCTIAAKGTADAFTLASGITTQVLHFTDNTILTGNVGMKFSGASTTALVSGNYIAPMGTSTFNSKNNVVNWFDGGNNSWNFVSAAPTSNYWHVGTRVYNISVAAGGTVGWVCTAAGTPGTWKTFGTVSP